MARGCGNWAVQFRLQPVVDQLLRMLREKLPKTFAGAADRQRYGDVLRIVSYSDGRCAIQRNDEAVAGMEWDESAMARCTANFLRLSDKS